MFSRVNSAQFVCHQVIKIFVSGLNLCHWPNSHRRLVTGHWVLGTGYWALGIGDSVCPPNAPQVSLPVKLVFVDFRLLLLFAHKLICFILTCCVCMNEYNKKLITKMLVKVVVASVLPLPLAPCHDYTR